MLDHFSELLHLIVRWVHLIAGIMWIGNSMLFNWLDRNLEQAAETPSPGSSATIWMVHSGAFYEVEKKFARARRRCRRPCTGSSGRTASPG